MEDRAMTIVSDSHVNDKDLAVTNYNYTYSGLVTLTDMLRLKRNGLFGPGIYETVDDVTSTYQGNQLQTLREAADDVMLESSLDVRAGEYGEDAFAYDANGNLCRDMSRGVADVEYNLLNLPQKVTMEDGSSISYIYSASGTKLAEIISNADGETLFRRDWVGTLEFANRIPERLRLPDGYITLADTTYHAFIPDYQGNIVGVYNSAAGYLEQLTDYYPYGLPLATSSNLTANRTKFGAKDLTTDQGLNLYDFSARWHNPAFPQFTTSDPYAEDYQPLSPYIFCANDPINFVDPTGCVIKVVDESAQKIILYTLKKEDRDFITFSSTGILKVNNYHYSDSKNYNILAQMAESDIVVNILVQNYYIYSDNNKNINIANMGEIDYDEYFYEPEPQNPLGPTTGETGFYGKTLLPGFGESNQNSPDNNIYIIINRNLSNLGAAQTFSHEAYGHAAIYMETLNRKASAHDFQIGGRDNNRNLILRIRDCVLETTKIFTK